MFYVFSKIFWFIVAPLNLFLVVTVLYLMLSFTRYWRISRRVFCIVLALTLVLTLSPVNSVMLSSLESRFPVPGDIKNVTGILLLGANWHPELSHIHGIASITNQPGRLVAFVRLGRQNPGARMVVAAGEIRQDGYLVSDTVKMFANEVGFDNDRIQYNHRGRNTHETIRFAHQLANPLPGDKWILITSASHMPRSVGVARQTGWLVIPYPTDFSASAPIFDVAFRFLNLNASIREWCGLAAYALTGRISEFFPGP